MSGDGVKDLVVRAGLVERSQGAERLAGRHLLGRSLGPAPAAALDGIVEGDLRRVLTPVTGTGGGHDPVLGSGQEPLLGHLLQPSLVVVVGPGLDVDQAAGEEPVGSPVSLVEEDGADHGLESVGQDRLQRAGAGLVRAFAQGQVVAETPARGQPGQAPGVDDGGAQPGQLALVRGLVSVVQVLGGDQLEDRIAQVLEALVVGQSAVRMLIDVGAVGQRLAQEGKVVETDPECPL